jgi:tyrosinase
MSVSMQAQPEPEPQLVGASQQSLSLVGAPEDVSVELDPRAQSEALALHGVTKPRHIVLHLEDIEAKENPGSVYGVYVNLPENADEQQLDSHHVGNLSFFGIEQAQDPAGDKPTHGIRSSMDITGVAKSLEAQGEWDGRHVHVSLRPLGLDAGEGADAPPPIAMHEDLPVKVGRVSISYA